MRILEELKGCRTIGISGHENPDGDCAGSCMGLALFLRKTMPEARVDVFLEPLRHELAANIPGSGTIITDFRIDLESYDAFIVLDSAKDRISGAETLFDRAAKTINIDHHVSNPGTGMVNYVNGTSSSTCELVYEVLDRDMLDEQIAQALYVGMVTDTGCFRFSNTSRKTMDSALIFPASSAKYILKKPSFSSASWAEPSPRQRAIWADAASSVNLTIFPSRPLAAWEKMWKASSVHLFPRRVPTAPFLHMNVQEEIGGSAFAPIRSSTSLQSRKPSAAAATSAPADVPSTRTGTSPLPSGKWLKWPGNSFGQRVKTPLIIRNNK